jgi:hypothetical protein
MPCTFTANRPDSCAEYGWRQIGRCRGNFEWHHRSEIAPDSIIQQCASTNVVHSWNHGPRSPPKRTPVRPPAQPRTHGPAIGPELVQPCPVAGQHRRIPAGIVPNRISTDIPTQTPLRHIPAQLRRMLQIRFRPAVPIGVGIRAPGNGSRPLPHGMRERSCAEIRVSPEISGDHIHTQLQRFCDPPSKVLRAMQDRNTSQQPHSASNSSRGKLSATNTIRKSSAARACSHSHSALKPWGGRVLITSATCSERGWSLQSRPKVAGRCGRGKANWKAFSAAIRFLRIAVELRSKT